MTLYPFGRKRILSLFLLLICFSASLYAQKNLLDGYIVKKNGDSLRGLIDYRDWGINPQYIDFLVKNSEKSIPFSADDLRAFGVNGDRYESYHLHISPYVLHPENLTSQLDIPTPYDTTVFLQA